jgi:hypothetical protein
MVAYIFNCAAGDFVEFFFESADATAQIISRTPAQIGAGYTGPAAPSVIIDVEQVCYAGPTGPTGCQQVQLGPAAQVQRE